VTSASDWPVFWLDTIDSTNTEAVRRIKADFPNQWIAAREQTAGRGRRGRDWVSPPGNLFTTALFLFDGDMTASSRLPFVAGLAVSDAALRFTPNAPVQLKWPNDVRVEGAKLSGILIEAGKQGEGCWVAAGMGVNVSHVPETAGQAATCIAALRGDDAVTADMFLDALREAFAVRLKQYADSFETIRADWLARAEGLGETVRVIVGDSAVEGVFEDMGPDGSLILRLPNGTHRPITAGDVELIRERTS